MRSPSIAPHDAERDTYLVLDDFGGLHHVPRVRATILRTNSGSSCLWLRMIPSLGTNATIFRDFLRHCTMQLRLRSAMPFDN
jgi:hypothetical protein